MSVVVPVRGAAPHLRGALDSALRQDLEAIEVVVVDDGMTPSATAVVASLQGRDRRLRLLTPSPGGLVPALNLGVAEARAPLIARLDSDDLCHPRRLSLQVARLRGGDVGVVGCRVRSFPRAHVTPRWRAYEGWLNSLISPTDHLRDLWVESPLCHPTALFLRRPFEEIGGYRDGDFPEDYDLWLRLAAHGVGLCKVPEVLLLWREHADRLTRVDSRYRAQAFCALKAAHLATAWGLRERGVVVWGAGEAGKALGRALVAVGVPPRCYVDIDPRKIGGRVGGVPVVAPAAAPWDHTSPPLVVVAVGTPGVRPTVRSGVAGCGLVEGRDFVMAA